MVNVTKSSSSTNFNDKSLFGKKVYVTWTIFEVESIDILFSSDILPPDNDNIALKI